MMTMNDDSFLALKESVMKCIATPEMVRRYTEEVKNRDVDPTKVEAARRKALVVADDFFYGDDIKNAIKECGSVLGINRILIGARG